MAVGSEQLHDEATWRVLPAVSPEDRRREALEELAGRLEGELLLDEAHRRMYSVDASIYSEAPLGVARPRSEADVRAILELARQTGTALIPRGGGTSLAGQVVGSGLVIDLGRHMNQIYGYDPSVPKVVVEPGVIQDDLNRYLKPHGVAFGPDTSTSNRAMIGGMIGNNSCGSYSILHGTTRDHVHQLDVLLADGTPVSLKAMDRAEIDESIRSGSRLGSILLGLRQIAMEYAEPIRRRFPAPDVVRRNTGYALDELLGTALVDPGGKPLNLCRLVCGSEGTLAIVLRAALRVVPLPRAKGVVVAHFDTLGAAMRSAVDAVALKPAAVELIDKPILDLTIDQLEQRHNRFFLQGDPAAILLVEFYRDTPAEVAEAKAALIETLQKPGLAYACVDIAPVDESRVWSLRKAGLGLLMGIRGPSKAVCFIEDTAVPVARLPEYVERIDALMRRHGTSSIYYGHASVGELHLRPMLDLRKASDVARMDAIAREVAELVGEFGGSLSGEHGDGRVRAPYHEIALGPELVEAFRKVKRLWDPQGILNPGKIVDAPPATEALRAPVEQPIPEVRTYFHFDADEQGLMGHLERCNGAGVCRRLAGSGGVMCPSYMATREEMHTTRGRANLFRELLTHRHPEEAMAAPELNEALSLCLGCKGCKAECPASVDVARLKSEYLQHYYDQNGTPLSAWLIGRVGTLSRLALLAPRLANWMLANRWFGGLLKRMLGIDPRIDLPPVSQVGLRQWFRRRGGSKGLGDASTVALFVDEFTTAQDVEVGKAAIEVLEALGHTVLLPKHRESGRALISKGLVRAAAKLARANVRALHPLVRQGIPILGLEPSAALTLLDEAPDLVPQAERAAAREVAAATMLWEDFVAREARTRDISGFFDDTPRRIWLHGHCHQKALVGAGGSLAALRIPGGHRVELIQSTCCGMAGSFGYEHRDVSLQIAELHLFPALRKADRGDLVAAPGFSCRHQIADGLQRKAMHPAEILRMALRTDG